MNFAASLLASSAGGHRIALIDDQGEHTYDELRAAVEAVARDLRRRGVRRGECVGLTGDASFFWAAAYLGAMHAGAVAVPLSPGLTAEDCAGVVRSTAMRVAFFDPRSAAAGKAWPCAVAEPITELPIGAAGLIESPADCGKDELAALLFSSGSTGRPRGIMISHGNLAANTASIISALQLSAADRAMAVLPFHYCFGASLLHTHLAVGGSLVIDKRFLFADKVLQRMIDTRCTGFAGVPSHYQILLRRSQFGALRFPELRWLQQGGGRLPEPFVRELRALKPELKLFLMYGATEATARICVLPPGEVDARPRSIGRPIAGVAVRLCDEEGREVPPGAVGEIVVTGDNVARGYFGDPEETAATFKDGALHTGDLATRDEDGFLTVVDRAKSFLKCGGTRTSCARVEEALLAFPEIVEAAVIGVPDELLGEAVAALVVARDPSDASVAERLAQFAKAALPPALQPKLVELVAALPKNAAGKVRRVALRELLATSQARAA